MVEPEGDTMYPLGSNHNDLSISSWLTPSVSLRAVMIELPPTLSTHREPGKQWPSPPGSSHDMTNPRRSSWLARAYHSRQSLGDWRP
jgi:hypothetical protein